MYHITNDPSKISYNKSSGTISSSSEAPKTFLYEFCKEGLLFKIDDLDTIICNRLMKQKDENKFVYLYETYGRLVRHLFAKRKDL